MVAEYVVEAGHRTIRFTTTPDVVDTVTFEANVGAIEVYSDGAADVWFTVNGGTPSVPADGVSTEASLLPAGGPAVDNQSARQATAALVVQVVSPGAAQVAVRVP